MLEHASTPWRPAEASASILWRDASKAQEAATSMKITAQDLLKFGIIDAIVAEPAGGAHRDPKAAIAAVGEAIRYELSILGTFRASRSLTFARINLSASAGRPSALGGAADREPHLNSIEPRASFHARGCAPRPPSQRRPRSGLNLLVTVV